METKFYELTNPQKSIWYTEEYYKGSPINNICGSFIIKQETDLKLLNSAINYFIRNNDSFRLRFNLMNGEIYQYLTNFEETTFELLNIENENQIESFAKETVNNTFDILNSKPFCFKLFKLKNGYGGFIVNCHHIISDAATFSLIAHEVAQNYYSLLKNEPIEEKNFSYIDYINNEKEYINSDRYQKDKAYWEDNFKDIPEIVTIPTYNTSDSKNAFMAHRKECIFKKTLVNKMTDYCKSNNISMFNFLTAIYSIYFGKINNMNCFSIGTPILNRSSYSQKNTSGMFINTSLLKINIDSNNSFAEHVKNISHSCMQMLRHQKYNYQCILSDIRKNNPTVRTLYDIMISYQITQAKDSSSSLPYYTKWYGTNYISNTLDIHFHDNNDSGNLLVEYDYQISKLSESDIISTHQRIVSIINQVLKNTNVSLNTIEVITQKEKKDILLSCKGEIIDFPKNKTIIDLFKEQVNKKPNDIAIDFEGIQISYKDLDLKSNAVAKYLTKNGFGISDIISIYLPRSLEYYISILGILKVGAIYLPLDIEYPLSRITYMLNDSHSKLCISNLEYKNNIPDNISVLNISDIKYDECEFTYINIPSSNGCYIIYTSGSTGTPKGILASHRNVINYTYSFQNEFHLKPNIDVVLQQFTPCFDAFVEEFYPSLLNGIKIFAVSKNTIYNFPLLKQYIQKNNITLISCSPLLLNEINNSSVFPSIRTYISGGDVLKPEYFSNLITTANVYNTYGPTETTVCSTYHKCSKNETFPIPIGKTIANYKNFILSKDGSLMPKGFVGELGIAGEGVTLGYYNNTEKTNKSFINYNGELLYKTGDLCRINSDNEIEFIGRIDSQLKINGYRVDLIEIENMLNQYPGITTSVVTSYIENNNRKKICAYYIGASNITSSSIKEYLLKVMPQYMIPSIFIRIDSIPTNTSGKIDKSKLPDPNIVYNNTTDLNFVKPSTKTQIRLAKIWKQILNLNKISIDADLFDLGADSLSVIEFQSLIVDENWDINAQEVYSLCTIRKIAEHLDKNNINNSTSLVDIYADIDISQLCIHSEKNSFSNILLTGANGFLGIHLLDKLIHDTSSHIFCLIRGKDHTFAQKKLFDLYNFYFDSDLSEYESRITIITGDISKEYLGMSISQYNNLTNIIDTVIHSAAVVKHYGNTDLFEKINVIGTQNVIDFCLKSNSQLHHISTVSVSGQYSPQACLFTENDFYIGQNYNDNIYIKSKFEAEYRVLNSIKTKNLYAKIYRIRKLNRPLF